MAGFMKQHFESPQLIATLKHTKAHRELGAGDDDQDNIDIRGNYYADIHAKKAADHIRPCDGDIAIVGRALGRGIAVLRAMAKVLALWPKACEMYPDLARAGSDNGARRRRAKELGGHSFSWTGTLWVCKACLRYKRAAVSRVDTQKCVAVPQPLLALAAEPLGHKLYLTQVQGTLAWGVFCKTCGFFAFTIFLGLKGKCQGGGQLSKGTSYRLGRMLKGLHPLGNRWGTLLTPWPLRTYVFDPPPPPSPPSHTPILAERGFSVEDQLAYELEADEEVDLW